MAGLASGRPSRQACRGLSPFAGVGGPEPVFIKPQQPKQFTAGLYSQDALTELASRQALPASTGVLVSPAVRWLNEFRCFCLGQEVRTCSVYLRDGHLAKAEDETWPAEVGELEEAQAFVRSMLNSPASEPLPRAIVIDVGRIDGVGWAVVEANAAWGSGLYGCDPAAALDVVAAACQDLREGSPGDSGPT